MAQKSELLLEPRLESQKRSLSEWPTVAKRWRWARSPAAVATSGGTQASPRTGPSSAGMCSSSSMRTSRSDSLPADASAPFMAVISLHSATVPSQKPTCRHSSTPFLTSAKQSNTVSDYLHASAGA